VVTLFLLALAGIVAGILANLWQLEIRIGNTAGAGMVAFYAAEAGLERGKACAEYPGSICGPQNSWINFDSPNRQYRFNVTGIGGGNRRIRSAGRFLDNSGKVLAQRQVTVDVDTSGAPSQYDWTWREE